VVYPEGVKIVGNRTWNAGGCCASATTLNIDDVGVVNSLLKSNEQVLSWIKDSFVFIQEEANIPLSILDNATYEDKDIHYFIGYFGRLGGKSFNKIVKVDISRGETLVFEQRMKRLFISYSDLLEYKLLCYSLEEVMIEKCVRSCKECKHGIFNYKERWERSLSQQIKDIPDFEQVEREVLRHRKEMKV
jgi:hypothetical protein